MSESPKVLDRAALSAHDAWLGRNRSGAGRLDVKDVDATGADLRAARLAAVRFDHVKLGRAILGYADLNEAELIRCELDAAQLSSCGFQSARLMNCTATAAVAELATFDGATVYGSKLDRTILITSQWRDARVSATSFESANLGNANLDRAQFTDCDFRGARLGPVSENPPPSMRGAVFENCDFSGADFTRANISGATFKRCKFAGARGEPKSVDGVTITGSDIGDQTRVLAALSETMSVDAVVKHPGPLLAARDAADPAHIAVFVVDNRAAPLTRLVPTPALDGLRKGATYGRSGIVWAADDLGFTVWDFEKKAMEVRGNVITWPGGPIDRATVTRVASFVNPESLGNRGVKLVIPSLSYGRIVVVQENDFAAEDLPSYTREAARRDGQWALHLGRDLASWLGVPHDNEL